MKLIKYLVFIVFFVSFGLIYSTSCTFDNEEDLLKNFICDTNDIVYNDLTYIFTDICSVCHKEGDTERLGIEMDSYLSVKASMNTGLVLQAINHTGPYKMPFQQAKLSDCDIDKIEAWVNADMPEN
ncbi:MAG: hypothetical protein GQ564_20315 [Bacteroidales bacterium]|nr:hypothetical protein [Bacteroidales bacterium]